ncbi:unnamed protein product [Adineta ricciae]|uniref:Uncharacterized protein n=2 Tax=Adineta ricciae TaxID=249248 RepID=A0A814C2I9_ADIRI|nr:unnamed protein product [Adineta ricciae]
MTDDENKTEFLIQEYECGEKANIYQIDHEQKAKHLSTKKSKSHTSLTSLFRAFFYPDNYPLGVSSDYGIYQLYNIVQTGCIAISGSFAFSALFRAMGVGKTASNYLAASIVWLLRDGAGMIGRIIFAWGFAASLDADCKRWHFLGDVLNDVACVSDMITPYFPSALLFISSISNICRSVTGVIHGSTRTVIFQHQARNNNLADIAAKCSSLETMVSLVALFVNVVLLATLPETSIWPIFLVLTAGHLWATYKAKRCILFNLFNRQRFHLVCSEYFKTNGRQTLSIEEVNDREPILFKTSFPYRSHIGVSLKHIPEKIFPSQKQLKNFHSNDYERFLILHDQSSNTFYVLLRTNSDTDDLIRLNFFIEIISYAMNSTTEENFNEEFQSLVNRIQKQLPDLNLCLTILHEDNDRCYEQFKQVCLAQGYNFHRCLFDIGIYRIH